MITYIVGTTRAEAEIVAASVENRDLTAFEDAQQAMADAFEQHLNSETRYEINDLVIGCVWAAHERAGGEYDLVWALTAFAAYHAIAANAVKRYLTAEQHEALRGPWSAKDDTP